MNKIYVILSSTRQGRAGEQFAQWIYDLAKSRSEFDVELIDLRDLKLPFFDESTSPGMAPGKYTLPAAAEWAKKVAAADGYIVVTPEYNHGYPAVLKNALDYAYAEWNHKPIGFVSYGGAAGGARSVEQLRLVSIELQMAPVRNAVVIPNYWEKMDKSGKMDFSHYTKSAEGMLDQLSWWASLLKTAREQTQK